MSKLTREMVDDLIPKGPIWEPEFEGDFDLLLDGIADNLEAQQLFLSTLSDIRNPLKTTVLSDLEREYGVATNLLIPEATRRASLAEIVFGRSSNGTEDDLQTALRNSGFDVYVYQNDPAVDPDPFLNELFQMVAGGGNAYAGRDDAYAGQSGGELLVNGEIFKTERIFTSVAGGGLYAGDGHGAGEYDDLQIDKIEYPVPTDPNDWPMVFFVGGAATLGFINKIINGGFETGDFTGWTQNNSTIDNINPASGTYCSKLVAPGIDLLGAQSDAYDIDPIRTYTVKTKNDVTAYATGNYRNVIEFYDKDDLRISTAVILDKTAVTVGYEQTEKTIGRIADGADFDIPITTRKIRILQEWAGIFAPTGTAYMDDVEFYRSDKESIISIDNAPVDIARQDEFRTIILRYKPLHSWAALIVTYS